MSLKKIFSNIYVQEPQRVIVRSGDVKLCDQTIDNSQKAITFDIPADCVKDGLLRLQLEYPDAISPLELGENTDARTLALAFKSIKLTAKG